MFDGVIYLEERRVKVRVCLVGTLGVDARRDYFDTGLLGFPEIRRIVVGLIDGQFFGFAICVIFWVYGEVFHWVTNRWRLVVTALITLM